MMGETRPDEARMLELCGLAALRMASALARLAGCRLQVGLPAPGRRVSQAAGPLETGLFVEVEGALGGVAALVFSPGAQEMLAKALLGDGEASDDAVESALRELGNIVASQALSAMADALGGRLLPSVPILASRGGEAALAALLRRRGCGPGADRYECLLEDRDTGMRVLFVFAPDPGGRAGSPAV